MRFTYDHDLHIHSRISPCGGDPNQTPERILQYAVDNGLKTICITDHYWDGTVAHPHGTGAGQTTEQIKSALPLPQKDGIRFLFGAEVDMTLDGTVGISSSRLAAMDFLLISISHFHCTDFTIRSEDAATAEGKARVLLDKLEQLLDMPLPWHKISLAHLVGQKVSGGDPDLHCQVIRLLMTERLTTLFKKAAALGVGIELNTATFSFGNDAEREAVTAFYAHAKECGCKFTFGSDAHAPFQWEHHRERAQAMADALGLTEEDIFRV